MCGDKKCDFAMEIGLQTSIAGFAKASAKAFSDSGGGHHNAADMEQNDISECTTELSANSIVTAAGGGGGGGIHFAGVLALQRRDLRPDPSPGWILLRPCAMADMILRHQELKRLVFRTC